MKATSLFGGVQVFQIIIGIIRSKAVAVLLGPLGMGINGLLLSTTGLISGLTNFGLGTSAIKNVAAAHATGDENRLATVVNVLRRLVWVTGTLGALITLVCSKWLSRVAFGNADYSFAFIWISVTLLLNQISTGQSVILRGTRQLNLMAKASASGAVLGLIISVPIYYFWGIDGIVPAIIVSSMASLLRTWYFSRKVMIKKVEINKETVINESKGMLSMGFLLSLSGIIAMGASYLIRIYISNTGGVDQVGLYNAGFAIINTYVGMVFIAMSTDYYPRLSGVSYDNKKAAQLINQQSEIAILIIAPVLAIFIVFIQYVVILLYSTKFIPIYGMIQWAALGIYFKTISWALAFLILAKGASRTFFLNELIANIYVFGFNVVGYKIAGLKGLGISFLAAYIIYFLQVYVLARWKYEFSLHGELVKIFLIQFALGISSFSVFHIFQKPLAYFPGVAIIGGSCFFSFKELNKRLEIKALIKSIKIKAGK
ncbi:MAG: O-antigen translocase [Acidobacteriota bacterium]|nr:O-antigen translocase [Acidobacteriota bacterium]